MNKCPNCKWSIVDNKNTLNCMSCNLPIHIQCLDIAQEEVIRITRAKSKSLRIVCNGCCTFEDKFNKLTDLISKLSDRFASIEERLEVLEQSSRTSPMEFEDCVQESIARHQKSFNLILYNLPEPEGDDKEAEDVSTVSTIIDTIKPLFTPIPSVDFKLLVN
uniref:Uncharacterized protein LOC114348339 n=1 Tax=Diabrotica virgifera virgifera TaxID=50390 RepID=A0A6P7HG82_DIAVI